MLAGFALASFTSLASLYGNTFNDNFERAELGSDWSRIGGNAKWTIDTNRLIYEATTTASSILFNNTANLTGASSWTLEVNINFPNVSAWSGVAFNINPTDPEPIFFTRNSFYVLRVNPTTNAIQWLKYPGGGSATPQTLVNTTSANNIPVETDLRIVVEAIDNNGAFSFEIFEGETSIYQTNRVNGTDPFSGGTVGYYSDGGTVNFINSDFFNLEAVMPPRPVRFFLEKSEDLATWQTLPVDSLMIDADGAIAPANEASSHFYRLRIEPVNP